MHEAERRVAGICRLFGAVPNNKTRMEFSVYMSVSTHSVYLASLDLPV